MSNLSKFTLSLLRTIKGVCSCKKQRRLETISRYKPKESSRSGFRTTSRLNTNTDILHENIKNIILQLYRQGLS